MTLDELRAKRLVLQENDKIILDNIQKLADESSRVADVAHNSRLLLEELDKEFERQTGLNKTDFGFLFFATALQVARIIIVNRATHIEKAGDTNRFAKKLKARQKKIMDKLADGKQHKATEYYAPLNQIVTTKGVPYDISKFEGENTGIFKGADHRFVTIGHDPLFGLIFGTANILTNTITTVDEALLGFGRKGNEPRKIPIGPLLIESHHVKYTQDIYDEFRKTAQGKRKVPIIHFKSPLIGEKCSTALILQKSVERLDDDKSSVIAAVIKQVIHIGTDMYTPCGIQIPGANLILTNKMVENLTKYVSMGDVIKVGGSAGIAALINLIIGTLHGLTYDDTRYDSRDVFAVKTKKILMISNSIATGSNLIWVGANVAAGNERAIKDLDIGGLLITIHRLITDIKFIAQVKEEFIFGGFNKMIQGEPLMLKEVNHGVF